MPAGLDSLPFDVFHTIACSLDVREYVHLSQACKRANELLRNESTARLCLQVRNCKGAVGRADCSSEASRVPMGKATLATVSEGPSAGPFHAERPFARRSLTRLPLSATEPTSPTSKE